MAVPRIIHVIGSLETGGAERVLTNLLSKVDRSRAEYGLISLTSPGALRQLVEPFGIPLWTAGMRRGVPHPGGLWQLIQILRRERPDLVVTWMYHSNLLGGIAAAACGIPVIWNIRDSGARFSQFKPATRLVSWASRACARILPRQVVFVSESGRDHHVHDGYRADRAIVIPNGFDTNVFRPNSAARAEVRKELRLSETTPLIGLLGRVHPDKDHLNFLAAARLVHKSMPQVRFLFCGKGASIENREMAGWIRSAGLEESVIALDCRSDMPRIAASLDLLVSSSSAEAFPNVVGEAMSSGVPCVVTNVGDSARLVGETGHIVPCRDPAALAHAMLEWSQLSRHQSNRLGAIARERIQRLFSIEDVVLQHERVWLAGAARRIRPTIREKQRAA